MHNAYFYLIESVSSCRGRIRGTHKYSNEIHICSVDDVRGREKTCQLPIGCLAHDPIRWLIKAKRRSTIIN